MHLESVVKYAKKHDSNNEGCLSACSNGCVIGERRKVNLNLMLDNRTEQLTAEVAGESNETLLMFIISTENSCGPVLGRDSVDCQG